MATASIGLDVGTHAVRAVEIAFGRGLPVLQKVGQVALPPGAVIGGEVVDPAAVADALRRLWREVGFSSKNPIVGVANQRVVARLAEVPNMPEEELRSSLRFQVQDLIPIPIDDAILDFQVVEEITGPDGQEQLRVLLVAAHKDMVGSLLTALDGAGLSAARIDLIPFALIRALHDGIADLGEEPNQPGARGTEAIIGIGAGVTNVVVHAQGLPRFVRSLATGGNAITDAIAADQGVEPDIAEDLKRHVGEGSDDQAVARAERAVPSALGPILEEIRGSLDFYLAQAEAGRLARVLLTGGSSRIPGLADRLSGLLGVPVAHADPLATVERGATGLADDVLERSADVLAVPIGLALSGESLGREARRITLLPREIAVVREERRQLIGAGAGVAALVVLLLAIYLLRQGQVNDAEAAADAEEARTVELQQEIASLQDIAALEVEIGERRASVVATLEGDVAWTRLLQEVATVLPNDVWLTSFQGTAGADPTAGGLGTVQVSAMGFDQTSTARWLLRVSELRSVSGLWVPSSTKTPADTGQELVTFSSSANLTEAAESDRVQRYVEDDQ
jgi:type IV pilus assembly protein PilM